MRRAPSIAIIGAGFSGALLAVHLVRKAAGPLEIALIDRAGSLGRGLAYSSVNPNHLLNVRVENMSALPEHPNHFRDWLERRTGVTPDSLAFVSRGLYGAYIEEILEAAVASASGRVTITTILADCVAIRRNGRWRLRLADGRELSVDAVALCLGHFPPRFPAGVGTSLAADPRAIRDPWRSGAFAAVAPADRVVIVGSGLTMADVAVELEDRGHRGPITVVSRHGLLPNVHAPTVFWPSFVDPDCPPRTSRELLGLVREQVARAQSRGVDWRSVLDSMRPHLIPLWRALPLEEQRRALRHLRAYWDVHRHRVAPEIDARLRALRDGCRLRVVAGALVGARARPEAIELDVRLRGGARISTLSAERVVNCTGPTTAFATTEDPLVRTLPTGGSRSPTASGSGSRSRPIAPSSTPRGVPTTPSSRPVRSRAARFGRCWPFRSCAGRRRTSRSGCLWRLATRRRRLQQCAKSAAEAVRRGQGARSTTMRPRMSCGPGPSPLQEAGGGRASGAPSVLTPSSGEHTALPRGSFRCGP